MFFGVMTLSCAEKKVLRYLATVGECMEEDMYGKVAKADEVRAAVSWLRIKGMVEVEENIEELVLPGRNAILYAKEGLPEYKAMKILREHNWKAPLKEIKKSLGKEAGIAIGKLRELGCRIENGEIRCDEPECVEKEVEERMKALRDFVEGKKIEKEHLEEFVGRKGFVERKKKTVRKIKITEYGRKEAERIKEIKEEITVLTPELIKTGKWRDYEIRKYDITLYAPEIHIGRYHPLTVLKNKIREIFLSMGFEEIEDFYVQTAFWDMDALFMPQDHPARDMQDSLYVGIGEIDELGRKYIKNVKKIHEEKWHGVWSEDEAKKLMLRTHTTVNTIRYLARNKTPPIKVFSIGKVFRRESIDSTHLPEFTQIEGIVMEENASLSMLFGILKEFYRKMGFEKIRLRPSYFPYTEPSLEVEVFFNGEYLELGGAGIFRPEVLEPLGINYPVLAWGLGLERLAMILMGVNDIRNFYISDVDFLRKVKEVIL